MAAAEQPKLALIIANSDYGSDAWPDLKNPINDARLIAQSLQQAGFTVQTPAVNLRRAQMVERIESFRSQVAALPANSIALIYFSGHGVQIDGTSYLVPSAGKSPEEFSALKDREREDALIKEYVSLNRLLNAFGPERRQMKGATNILILDACRDNPMDGRTRSAGRTKGLADIPTMANTLVAYAAEAGKSAFDGDAKNSPYAASLAAELVQTSVPLQVMFTRITARTLDATGGVQRPDYRVGLSEIVCLKQCSGEVPPALVTRATAKDPISANSPTCAFCPLLVKASLGKQTVQMTQTPITLAHWRACVEELGCAETGKKDDPGLLPVTDISWASANAYAAWLSSRTGVRWRLPSSEEWDAAFAPFRRSTRAISKRLPQVQPAKGEVSLTYIGKVLEWTSSCAETTEPCANRVARGASYDDDFSDLLERLVVPSTSSGGNLGFRLIKDENEATGGNKR